MEAIAWYVSWPIVIYGTWKFVEVNVKHMMDLERLAAYDAEAKKKNS